MAWPAHLTLDYRHDGTRSVLHSRHDGPLRVLKSLYPEAHGACHTVIVHPPGGIVGGDRLAIEATLAGQSHAVVTTPGATRFYRSAGDTASQTVDFRLATGARLEWLPMETIVHRAAEVENRLRFELARGAQMIGWDLLALGLPASGEGFDAGRVSQRIEIPGTWLERGTIAAADTQLMKSPLGLAGFPVVGIAWIASGHEWPAAMRARLLDASRDSISQSDLVDTSGATSVDARIVQLRVLASRVEPAMHLLRAVRGAWREAAWGLDGAPLRIWRT